MSHGGDRYRNKVNMDFSVNLNPLGTTENIKKSIINSLEELEYYPDPEVMVLRKKLSELIGIPEGNIVFGNGASELITALINAIRPRNILLPVPSFKGYERAIKNSGAVITEYLLNEDFDTEGSILDLIDTGVDMLFLTNPNNPTGRYTDHDLLKKILERCDESHVTVVMDECFMELSDEPEENTCIGYTAKYGDLVILRAFTKSFAIPSVRLGYLVTSDRYMAEKIERQLPEWNISGIAQAAGTAALDDAGYLKKARDLIKEQRKKMSSELRGSGFKVVDSNAGFMLIRYKESGLDLYEELLKREILIRDCSDYRNMPDGYYRVAVRTEKENRELIKNIKEIVREYGKY